MIWRQKCWTSQRRALISARLASDGQIVAAELAQELDLSEDTIRRDLRDMAAAGLLKRVHGGALPATPPLPDLETRQTMSTDVKKRLGRRAAELVRAGQLIFIDGGTTNAELVRALPREMSLTIATHSPAIAALLEKHRAEVILIGGRLYKHSMVSTGAAALAAIGTLRPGHLFPRRHGDPPGAWAFNRRLRGSRHQARHRGPRGRNDDTADGGKNSAPSRHTILPVSRTWQP